MGVGVGVGMDVGVGMGGFCEQRCLCAQYASTNTNELKTNLEIPNKINNKK